MKDQYSENYKILMKDTEVTQINGKIYCAHELEEHFLNDHTIQGNLQIQQNPYQNNNSILHRTRTNNFKICIETQKTLNIQNNFEKEE